MFLIVNTLMYAASAFLFRCVTIYFLQKLYIIDRRIAEFLFNSCLNLLLVLIEDDVRRFGGEAESSVRPESFGKCC